MCMYVQMYMPSNVIGTTIASNYPSISMIHCVILMDLMSLKLLVLQMLIFGCMHRKKKIERRDKVRKSGGCRTFIKFNIK